MSSDDIDLWRKATSDVKKQSSKFYEQEKKKKPIQINKSIHRDEEMTFSRNTKDLIVDDTSDIDKSTRGKIDRGDYPIDAELDLHGLNKEQAFDSFRKFVESGFYLGKRLLLVITGKGKKSNNGSVKLKDEFPKWVNHEAIKGMVVRFSHAARHHGGDGAFYVFLKRKREK